MNFILPEILWLLLLVPVLAIVYILIQRRRKKYVIKYSSLLLVKEALGSRRSIRRHIPPVLFLIGLMALIVSLARPATTLTLSSQQSTVILAMDVSISMAATDIKPSRLDAAKSAARVFITNQPKNVRIGVVMFGSTSAIVQGPTVEREALLAAIDRLRLQPGTAIGSGILTSLDAIIHESDAKSATDSFDKNILSTAKPAPPPLPRGTYAPAIIVLLSDGQSNQGFPPLNAAEQAVSQGVRIYTIGLGSPEGAIVHVAGQSVLVQLDEETLQHIAQKTDARYFKAGNEIELRNIYATLGTQFVTRAEKTEITSGFIGMATLLVIIAGALSLLWLNQLP